MLDSPLIAWNDKFLHKILSWKNLQTIPVGTLYQVAGFQEYNNLIKINSVFSSRPAGTITDRTQQSRSPFNTLVGRPWTVPTKQYTLDQALEQRVHSLIQSGKKINLFWSGGIDSTAVLTAFLKHTADKGQLRVLYSPHSVYEHPEYLNFLNNFSEIQLIDVSGTSYLTDCYDGVFVTGDGGDEMNASLDKSFIDAYGPDAMDACWREFFFAQTNDSEFIDFCEKHFSASGRPIETVLHARWWFYATCKTNSVMWQKLPWFFHYDNFDYDNFQGFFDCNEYENYIYWNIERVMTDNNYSSWKQMLKDYCYKFDGIGSWWTTKIKTHSGQVNHYVNKKCAVNDQRWLGVLASGQRLYTPSMPLLSNKELDLTYGDSLDYLFNEPY